MRPSDSNTPAARARDAALRRLRRVKRLILAGATALSGVLAVVAANSFPGRTVKARAASPQRSAAGTPQGAQGKAKPPTPLRPPATRPQPSPSAGGQGGGEPAAPSGREPAPPAASASPREGAGGPETTNPSAPGGEAAAGGSGNEAQAGAPAPREAPEARSEAPAQAQPEAPVVSGGS